MTHHALRKCYACVLLLGLSTATISSALADNNISIGRYVSVPSSVELGQIHLLQQQVQITFPQNVLSLKDAVNFTLQFTGYHLIDDDHMTDAMQSLLNQPLPEVDRQLGPFSLKDALLTLSGNDFYVLVDPVHRLISFRMRSYEPLYQTHSTVLAKDEAKDLIS